MMAPRSEARTTRYTVLAVLLALLFLAAGWFFYASGQGETEERAVERFTHLHGLELPPWAPGVLFVSTHHGLIRVSEGGHWQMVSEELHDFMGFSAHPSEEGVLFTSGHPAQDSSLPNPLGLLRSDDGGQTWQPVSLLGEVDFHAMAVAPSDGSLIYGWNMTHGPGLYRSSDEGESWDRLDTPLLFQAGGVLSLAVHPERPDELLAGTQAGLLHSTDAGDNWEPLLAGLAVTAVAYDPSRSPQVLAYGAHPEAGLLRSADGGGAWTRLGLVLSDNDAVGHIAIDPEKPEVIYLGSFAGDILRSTDGGRTWTLIAVRGEPQVP